MPVNARRLECTSNRAAFKTKDHDDTEVPLHVLMHGGEPGRRQVFDRCVFGWRRLASHSDRRPAEDGQRQKGTGPRPARETPAAALAEVRTGYFTNALLCAPLPSSARPFAAH